MDEAIAALKARGRVVDRRRHPSMLEKDPKETC
jgi:hypothetical protein